VDTEKLAVKSIKARKRVLGKEREEALWSIGMVR